MNNIKYKDYIHKQKKDIKILASSTTTDIFNNN
jgi:hypothetical protein